MIRELERNTKASPIEPSEWLDSVGEEFLHDQRFNLRPSEVIQSKLLEALPQGTMVPVSFFQNRRLVGR